ncbi:hypothetical protein VTN02DRAFT_3771 [Thermoascus thermophilus]
MGTAVVLLFCCYFFARVGYVPTVCFPGDTSVNLRRQYPLANSTGPLDVFQVYYPVAFKPESKGCNQELLLMEHVFAFSYGQPFIGSYVPPQCDFDTVRINLTVTSQGRQFDRLALMFLGDVEVFRTSTAEPTSNGIVWTYIKDMSQYMALWKIPQKLVFDLGNLIDDTYTGPFNVTLTASFTQQNNVKVADAILPISARRSASNSSSAFNLPSDNASVAYSIPATASRAIVSISACGQSTEEFWWSNVFSLDTNAFSDTVGALYGYSPFREIQLLIDGTLAGVVWPFPIIFTGGVAPGFWRPIVGIDAFDLREPEIDISPFLPVLADGKAHTFEIRVVGLDVSTDGTATLSKSVGSYWVVTGKIFLYLDEGTTHNTPAGASDEGAVPHVIAPEPSFTITRDLVQSPSNSSANESLSYSVTAERTLTVTSALFSWNQTLSYSNYGLISDRGVSQSNRQNTVGETRSTEIGSNGASTESHTTFEYPLAVNTTYSTAAGGFSIDASMSRGLNIDSSGGVGISTFTLTSGPSHMSTKQWGQAHYSSVGLSSGDTTDEFDETSGGTPYIRSVRAINGTVVSDTDGGPQDPSRLLTPQGGDLKMWPGRGSVKSMLGRGPGVFNS